MKTITINGHDTAKSSPTYATFGRGDLVIEGPEEMSVSDGFHTMDELYDHRIALYIALCKTLGFTTNSAAYPVWRSKLHGDGSSYDGLFILGIGKEAGKQISYHLPMARWEETDFAETLDKAPEWDGHTSLDVIKRLMALL